MKRLIVLAALLAAIASASHVMAETAAEKGKRIATKSIEKGQGYVDMQVSGQMIQDDSKSGDAARHLVNGRKRVYSAQYIERQSSFTKFAQMREERPVVGSLDESAAGDA